MAQAPRSLAIAAMLLAAPAAAQRATQAPADWWDRAWSARASFIVGEPRGPSVALELPTAALARADGADLRVFVAGGREVPARVLHCGPGDRILLYFDAAPFRDTRARQGHVYLGNPQARRGGPQWSGRHGITLEVRRLEAERVENPAQMELALKRSGAVLGRSFEERVFQGLNPFGDERRCLSVFSGFFQVRRDGAYHVAVNCFDAALLYIDGKVAVSWLGWHRPDHRSSKERSAELKLGKGAHPFTLLNATKSHGVTCSLGVRPPGAKRLGLAQANAFVPWTRARPAGLQASGGTRLAYFAWERESDLGLSGRAVSCVAFRDLSGIPASQRRGDFWDFGDGTTSRERDPRHVYLAAGTFDVTHAVYGRDGGQRTLAQKVWVHPSGTHGQEIYAEVARYAEVLAAYNPERLSAPALANAVFVLRAAEKFDAALPFLRVLVERAEDLDAPQVAEEVFFLVDELRDRRRDYARALEVLERVAEKSLAPERRLLALALMAELYFEHLGEPERASACLEKVLRQGQGVGGEALRFALIEKADLLLEAGDRTGARALLERAAAMRRGESFMGSSETSAGEHMVAYEEYSGRKDYTAALRELRLWEWAAPLDKLNGLLRYLRADLCVCLGRPREALRELARLEKADPESVELPAALIMASQCHVALGEKELARAALQRVLEEFPVSGARAEAQRRLEALDKEER